MLSVTLPSSSSTLIAASATTTIRATPTFNKQSAISLLSDQRSSADDIAALFKQAFNDQQQDALNDVILSIRQNGDFSVNEQVKNLLLDALIELVQHSNGTIEMREFLFTEVSKKCRKIVDGALTEFLPNDVCGIVTAYLADQIEFSARNRPLLKKIFLSDDIGMKEKIIRQAGMQGQERFLNKLFREIRRANINAGPHRLNLAGINLSCLELCGDYAIDLSYTNLCDANLQKAQLDSACLRGSDLRRTNLQDTNLKGANLRRSSLVGSNFHKANLAFSDCTNANFF